jgi:hypothetical protein
LGIIRIRGAFEKEPNNEGSRMEERVQRLEERATDHGTRISVMEKDLEHGSTIFEEVKKNQEKLSDALIGHMNAEEKRLAALYRVAAGWLFLACAGLLVYIWESQVGV